VSPELHRPFARIDVEEMRAKLPEISGGALKVWLAYLLRANRDGVAWPGTKVLATDTGMSASRASKLRNELLRDGWLVAEGCVRGKAGTFAAPRFRPVIPQKHRASKTAHGENTVRQESDSPRGENDSHRAAKMTHEVVPMKKNPVEAVGGADAPRDDRDFENPKTGRIKKFVLWWSEHYREKYSAEPTISLATEIKRLRPIFERNPDAMIESAAQSYLEDGTDFTLGHPLGKFASQFDRWRALGSEDDEDDDELSFRPPDYAETMRRKAVARSTEPKARSFGLS
jgi:hypothetical protein